MNNETVRQRDSERRKSHRLTGSVVDFLIALRAIDNVRDLCVKVFF